MDGSIKVSLPVRVLTYARTHRVRFALICVALVTSLVLICSLASPQDADAIAPIIIGAIAIAGLVGGATVGIDAATGAISDILRDGCNTLLTFAVSVMHWSSDLGMLTSTFENLIPGAESVIRGIHETVAVPVANIVLMIFLVVGLVKVVSKAGTHETAIDPLSLCLVFVVFAFMKAIIDSSFDLMVLGYNLVKILIVGTKDYGFSSSELTVQGIPEDVQGEGWLLAALIICLIIVLVSLLCAGVTYGVVLVRSVQIYVYTAFSSIPLAFFVSESSRSIATRFLKSYVAVLGAGAIMTLLLVLQAAIVGQASAAGTAITDFDSGVAFLAEITLSMLAHIAFAFCMLKSGSWARDFMGL